MVVGPKPKSAAPTIMPASATIDTATYEAASRWPPLLTGSATVYPDRCLGPPHFAARS